VVKKFPKESGIGYKITKFKG